MADRATADDTAVLLLRYFRAPSRFDAEALAPDAPPLDCEVLLKLALGRPVDFAEAALNRLSGSVLRDAAASYVRRVFFRPDATPYQTLGLAPDASADAIKDSFRLLMQLVHPDRQDARLRWPDACAAQANRAYGILRNEESRAKFDRDQRDRARAALAQPARGGAAIVPATPAGRRRRGSYGTLRRAPQAVLPGWLTEGIGGFVRRHPAPVVFSALVGGAALVIGVTAWDGQTASLTRETMQASAPARPAVATPAPESAAAVAPAPAAPPMVAVADAAMPPAPMRTPAPSIRHGDASSPVRAEPGEARRQAPGERVDPVLPGSIGGNPAPAAATPPPVPVVAVVAPNHPEPARSAPQPAETAIASRDAAPAAAAVAEARAPTTAEIEALFATFVEAYDRGRLDVFAALFDDDAESNLHRGRAAIRGEYDELFRQSEWRRMQLTRINWKRAGGRTVAKGEIAVKIGWRDGREAEQRVVVDMEMAHRDGRLVITRLSHQPRAP